MTEPNSTNKVTKNRKLSIRVTEAGAQRMERRAADADVTMSHMHRRMLTFADRHMPRDYLPSRDRAPHSDQATTNPRRPR